MVIDVISQKEKQPYVAYGMKTICEFVHSVDVL